MHYIGLILVGLIIGGLARFFLPGRQYMSWYMTALLGMAGSVLANKVGTAINLFQQGSFLSWIASVIASILLLIVYGMIKDKSSGSNGSTA